MLMILNEEFCETKTCSTTNSRYRAKTAKNQIDNPNEQRLPRKQILLIDPEEDLREVIKTGLELTTNWNILTTHDSHNGLHLAVNEQPNAILINIEKKDLGQIGLLWQLRQSQQLRQIPIILLLDRIRLSDRKCLNKLEIAGAIAKPFDMVNLGQQIAHFLRWDCYTITHQSYIKKVHKD
ncbi:MAG: response regulator [Oscillatoria sp. PMC 1051.18]|nr:response regulator [Oscillatoria sp. PMC 1050.18]MEC5028913.1 response regulator [Oscillatoria sp. PMC 1051.18]